MRKVSLFLILLPAGLFFIRPAAAELPASVVISEIAWMGSPASASDEWIELYNATLEPIDITGWVLQESDGSPEIILEGQIEAGAYFLLERTDDDTVAHVAADHLYAGALNNSDRTLTLYDLEGVVIDMASWSAAGPGDNAEDKPMERSADGTWATSLVVGGTPKAENSVWYGEESEQESEPEPEQESEPESDPETHEEVPPSSLPPQYGGSHTGEPVNTVPQEETAGTNTSISASLRLSEIVADPEGSDSEGEFVEIYNTGTSSASLEGWSIRDASGRTLILTGEIAAGAYIAFLSKHTNLPSLNNDGDVIELLDPSGTRRDGIEYTDAPEGFSLSFFAHGWDWTSVATPNAENILQRPKESEASENPAVPASSIIKAPPLADLSDPSSSSSESANALSAVSASSFSAALDRTNGAFESLPSLSGFSPPPLLFIVSFGLGIVVFILRRLVARRRTACPDPVFAVEETDDIPMA